MSKVKRTLAALAVIGSLAGTGWGVTAAAAAAPVAASASPGVYYQG